jgi:Asp/Glu/hydantoin racemase
MTKKLVLIHTGRGLVEKFAELCQTTMPDVDVRHVVDEGLIQETIAAGSLTAATADRLTNYIIQAEAGGADAIMVTCSSVGAAVDAARPLVHVPLLRVDQPMADQAVQTAAHIGVIATLSTTLQPTTELVRARAAAQGREVEVTTYLCEGAFQALLAGDVAQHDRMVRAGLAELGQKVELIILAQASMARVVDLLSASERVCPILSSPQLGVDAARQALTQPV